MRVAGKIGQLSYAQKRNALEALGVHVEVFPRSHNPRYVVTMAIPLEEASECTFSNDTS